MKTETAQKLTGIEIENGQVVADGRHFTRKKHSAIQWAVSCLLLLLVYSFRSGYWHLLWASLSPTVANNAGKGGWDSNHACTNHNRH